MCILNCRHLHAFKIIKGINVFLSLIVKFQDRVNCIKWKNMEFVVHFYNQHGIFWFYYFTSYIINHYYPIVKILIDLPEHIPFNCLSVSFCLSPFGSLTSLIRNFITSSALSRSFTSNALFSDWEMSKNIEFIYTYTSDTKDVSSYMYSDICTWKK